ncbi:MAG: hypothetical protein ACXQT5_07220, partial [Candidatus Syntropharchaeia archaeon]
DRIAAQFTYQMEMPSSEIDEKIGDRLELYYGTELSPANIWVCPKREGISLGIGSLLPEITEEVKKEIGRDLELGVKVRTKTSDIEAREKVIESLKADKEARDRFLLMAAGKHPLTEIARFW